MAIGLRDRQKQHADFPSNDGKFDKDKKDSKKKPLIIGGSVGVGVATVALVAALSGGGEEATPTTTIPEATTTTLDNTSTTLETVVTNPNTPVYDEYGFLVNPVDVTDENTEGGNPENVIKLLSDNLQYAILYNDQQLIVDMFGGEGSDTVEILTSMARVIESERLAFRWDTPEERVTKPFRVSLSLIETIGAINETGFSAKLDYSVDETFGAHNTSNPHQIILATVQYDGINYSIASFETMEIVP